LCSPLNVCDREVTAVNKWRTSTCFKLFFRVLRWYFTNREVSVNAWAGVLFFLFLLWSTRKPMLLWSLRTIITCIMYFSWYSAFCNILCICV
jgi:hypothetical protein